MNFFESCRHSDRLSLIVLDALARRPVGPRSTSRPPDTPNRSNPAPRAPRRSPAALG